MGNTIEEIIRSIHLRLPPSSGLNLDGMFIDIEHYLGVEHYFRSSTLERTQNSECMLRAQIVIADEAPHIQAIVQALWNVWASVHYGYFQASSSLICRDATVLRFITVISSENFFVSGIFVASGLKYPELIADYQRDFWRDGGIASKP